MNKLYAYIAVDPEGNEGIMGWRSPSGEWAPLVFSEHANMDTRRQMAQAVLDQVPGARARLVVFEARTELGKLTSGGSN